MTDVTAAGFEPVTPPGFPCVLRSNRAKTCVWKLHVPAPFGVAPHALAPHMWPPSTSYRRVGAHTLWPTDCACMSPPTSSTRPASCPRHDESLPLGAQSSGTRRGGAHASPGRLNTVLSGEVVPWYCTCRGGTRDGRRSRRPELPTDRGARMMVSFHGGPRYCICKRDIGYRFTH